MKVYELVKKLNEYNPNADIEVVVNGFAKEFKILYSGSEGCQPYNCDCVDLTVSASYDEEGYDKNDRLIALINDKQTYGVNSIKSQMDDRFNYSAEIQNEQLTNYLLENDVIVPPCKIGDTIYIVDEYSNEFDGIDECRVISLLWDGTSWMIFTNKDEYSYTESQIFFTKEEAIKGVKL